MKNSDKKATSTKVSETRQQRIKNEKKENRKKTNESGLTPFWMKFQVFCEGLPKLAIGLGILVLIGYVLGGFLPPGTLTALFVLDYLNPGK